MKRLERLLSKISLNQLADEGYCYTGWFLLKFERIFSVVFFFHMRNTDLQVLSLDSFSVSCFEVV